jgi:hypothetical protein
MQKIITCHFTNNGLPATGLVPIIDVFELHPTNPTINTHIIISGVSSEIGMGWYRYNMINYDDTKNYVFTFDGGAGLCPGERFKLGGNESYADDITNAVWNESTLNHMQLGSTGFELARISADTASTVLSNIAITSLLNTLLKYETNRTRIDPALATLTVYDDDCQTPLHVFNLRDSSGLPSIQEVCDRVPVGCGP